MLVRRMIDERWFMQSAKHLAMVIEEWHRANAAALRHDELTRLCPAQLRRLRIGRTDITRCVFDEFYAREDWRKACSCESGRDLHGRPAPAAFISATAKESIMQAIAVLYGVAAYAISLVTFLYAIGFVGNLAVPKSIDTGWASSTGAVPLAETLIVDVLLLGLFALQHSVMARQGFKRWWTKAVPASVERSTYLLFTCLALILLFAQWRPITTPIWSVRDPLAAGALSAIFWLGWMLVLVSTFLIDHLEMFGLKRAFVRLRSSKPPAPMFRTPFLYRRIRHPLYLGFLLAFWATPTMTAGHLLFALATSGYILIGIRFEERDLIEQFGEPYRRYRKQVGMLLPLPRRRFDKDTTSA
jgi:methanethiol S-methyltransferase